MCGVWFDVCVANVIICSVLLDYIIAPGEKKKYGPFYEYIVHEFKGDEFDIDDLTF